MNKRIITFVLALAIGFIFPISASAQTTMEWLVLSIMRSQMQASNIWQQIIGAGQEPEIFPTK
jgi:hypothetical protein